MAVEDARDSAEFLKEWLEKPSAPREYEYGQWCVDMVQAAFNLRLRVERIEPWTETGRLRTLAVWVEADVLRLVSPDSFDRPQACETSRERRMVRIKEELGEILARLEKF